MRTSTFGRTTAGPCGRAGRQLNRDFRDESVFTQAESEMRTAIRTGALCNRVVIGLRSSCSIHRLPEPLDRRGLKIELTRAGRKLVDRILPQLSD
jgi:hypothetical protein